MRIRTAYFEITNQCNLNCMTCYNRSGLNQTRKEMSKENLKKSIDSLIPLGLNRVLLSGGEPTLHSEFNEILDLVEDYPEFSFGVVTNGTVNHEKLIKTFNTRSNFALQVSLDGSCDKQNSKTRGEGNFAKTLNFIKNLNNKNSKPLIKMVISQNNYDDIENFYRFVISVGGMPEYAFVNKQGNGSLHWDEMKVSSKHKISALKLIDKLNHEFNIKAFLPKCTGNCHLSDGDAEMSVSVHVDGSIHPCQLLYDNVFVLGNSVMFKESEFHEKITCISALAGKRKSSDYGCSICILNDTCKRGCMAEAYNLTGNPLENDCECDFRKLQLVGFDIRNLIASQRKSSLGRSLRNLD